MQKSGTVISSESQIACEILTYLSEHPDAQDTLQGIVRWWLLEQRIRHQTSVVKGALSNLVARGLLVERGKHGVSPSYRINPDKVREVKDLMEKFWGGHIFEEGSEKA